MATSSSHVVSGTPYISGTPYGKTPTSTLVVMPPQSSWAPFVAIKSNHMNPKIKRPPYPHITMMQPFVERANFEDVVKILTEALSDFPPFECTLADFKVFDNGKSQTLYLDPVSDPPSALEALYQRLTEVLPGYALRRGFCAHIGVGFFRDAAKAEELRETYQAGWSPLTFSVTHLDLNFREDDVTPFSSRARVPLGGSS